MCTHTVFFILHVYTYGYIPLLLSARAERMFQRAGHKVTVFPCWLISHPPFQSFPSFLFLSIVSATSPCNFTRCFLAEAASLISLVLLFHRSSATVSSEKLAISFVYYTAMVHRFVQLLFFPRMCISLSLIIHEFDKRNQRHLFISLLISNFCKNRVG